MDGFSVVAERLKLLLLRQTFPTVTVVEKFTDTDWYVEIPKSEVEEFIEWCEVRDINCTRT